MPNFWVTIFTLHGTAENCEGASSLDGDGKCGSHIILFSTYLYINSRKSGSLFFVFSGKLPDGFLSNFAILFPVLFSGL